MNSDKQTGTWKNLVWVYRKPILTHQSHKSLLGFHHMQHYSPILLLSKQDSLITVRNLLEKLMEKPTGATTIALESS